jgi:restriction system protein
MKSRRRVNSTVMLLSSLRLISMNQIVFTDNHIQAIIDGDENAFNDLMRFIKRILRYELKRKRSLRVYLEDEDINLTAFLDECFEDMQLAVLSDALILVRNGKCANGLDLEHTVRQAVRRVVKRYLRQTERQSKHEVVIIDELKDERYFEEKARYRNEEDKLAEDELSAEVQRLIRVINEEDTKLLYKDEKSVEAESTRKADLLVINDELISYFKNHPKEMYRLNPRRFEELVAAILRDLGYSVELTGQSADGGVDIFATQKSDIGEVLLIVDCKRYAPGNHVGVEIIRALYGVSEQLRATMAMIATTSFFTKTAQSFQRTVKHRLSLKDYNDLNLWLDNYGKRK